MHMQRTVKVLINRANGNRFMVVCLRKVTRIRVSWRSIWEEEEAGWTGKVVSKVCILMKVLRVCIAVRRDGQTACRGHGIGIGIGIGWAQNALANGKCGMWGAKRKGFALARDGMGRYTSRMGTWEVDTGVTGGRTKPVRYSQPPLRSLTPHGGAARTGRWQARTCSLRGVRCIPL